MDHDEHPAFAGRLAPLRESGFRRLFTAELVSYLGSAATPVALSFAVLNRTHSASALGAVNTASAAPIVVLVLLGGVVGDRMRRRTILVGSSIGLAVTRGAFAALVLLKVGTTWELVACAGAGGVVNAFLLPASQAVIPEVVSHDHLRQANALLRLTRNGSLILGGALGGIVVAAIGPGWALVWDAAGFGLSAVMFAGTPVSASAVAGAAGSTSSSVIDDLRLGWHDFWSRAWLWSIVVQFAAVNAAYAAGFQLLGPVIAQKALGGARAWGFIVSGLAVGYVLGGLIALRWRVHRPLLIGTLGVFAMALPMLALADRSPLAVVVTAAGLAGVGLEQFGVGWSTVMQEQIPLDRLGRISSYDMLGSFVFIPVGFAIGGPISSAIGVYPTVWGSAFVVICATAAVLTCRDVRTIRSKAFSQ